MNLGIHNFVNDLVLLIHGKYNSSSIENEKLIEAEDKAFYSGANFAYYDALDMINSQLIAFGLEELCQKNIAPELGRPIENI